MDLVNKMACSQIHSNCPSLCSEILASAECIVVAIITHCAFIIMFIWTLLWHGDL